MLQFRPRLPARILLHASHRPATQTHASLFTISNNRSDIQAVLSGRSIECNRQRPRCVGATMGKVQRAHPTARTPKTCVASATATEFVFIPFAKTKQEKRKATKAAISHSMRAFRRKERDLVERGSSGTGLGPSSMVCILSSHIILSLFWSID